MARGFILGRVRARDRIDDDPDRQAGPNGQSRLDVDFAANKLLAGLVERVLAAAPQGGRNVSPRDGS
jgi:hypothetical protein